MSSEPINFDDAKRKARLLRQGLGYTYENAERTAALAFNYLKGGDEPAAEITATVNLPGIPSHIHQGRVKLNGPTSKKAFVAILREACDLIDWASMVELGCAGVIRAIRAGAPLEFSDPEYEGELEPSWLLKPLLMQYKQNALYGPGGRGKGWLAIAMAIAIQTGQPLAGLTATQGNVLYYDYEDDLDEFNKRIRAVSRGWGITPPRIAYRHGTERLDTQVEWLARVCDERQIKLLVIDSFTRAAGSSDHSSYEESAVRLLSAVRMLEGVTVLFIDHVTGSGSQMEGLVGKQYGSVMKQNLIRNNWEIKQDQEQGAKAWKIGLFQEKANHGERQPPLGFHLDFGVVPNGVRITRTDVGASPVLSLSLSAKARLERALRAGPKTVAELAAELDMKPDAIRKTFQRYDQSFVMVRGGAGRNGTVWGLRVS